MKKILFPLLILSIIAGGIVFPAKKKNPAKDAEKITATNGICLIDNATLMKLKI